MSGTDAGRAVASHVVRLVRRRPLRVARAAAASFVVVIAAHLTMSATLWVVWWFLGPASWVVRGVMAGAIAAAIAALVLLHGPESVLAARPERCRRVVGRCAWLGAAWGALTSPGITALLSVDVLVVPFAWVLWVAVPMLPLAVLWVVAAAELQPPDVVTDGDTA